MMSDIRPNSGESVEVPVGEWVDVPAGMVAAPGTYVDGSGVLRSSSNHAIAVWHNRKRGRPPCDFRVIRPDQITYVGGAPWCPRCAEYNRISEVLKNQDKVRNQL